MRLGVFRKQKEDLEIGNGDAECLRAQWRKSRNSCQLSLVELNPSGSSQTFFFFPRKKKPPDSPVYTEKNGPD